MSEEKNTPKKNKKFLQSIMDLPLFKKLKSIKHIEIIIFSIFIIFLLLICFSSPTNIFGSKTNSGNNNNTEATTYASTKEYVNSLENKLKSLISTIKDAGQVEVMISVENSCEVKFATEDTITTSGQKVEKSSKIVFVETGGQSLPIITNESLPKIIGIVVVSSGAKDTNVKLDIISCVQTLLNLPSSQIQVFVGN